MATSKMSKIQSIYGSELLLEELNGQDSASGYFVSSVKLTSRSGVVWRLLHMLICTSWLCLAVVMRYYDVIGSQGILTVCQRTNAVCVLKN